MGRFRQGSRSQAGANSHPQTARAKGLNSTAGAFTDLLIWYRAWLAFLLAGRNTTPTTGQAAITILTDTPDTLTIPGRNNNTYQVQQIPPQPVGTATPELAKIVATHIAPTARQSSIA